MAAYQSDAGGATVVSTVRGDRSPCDFVGRHEVADRAPLILVVTHFLTAETDND